MTVARERSGTASPRAGAAVPHAAPGLDQDLYWARQGRIGWTGEIPLARARSTVDQKQRPVRCPAGEGGGGSAFPSAQPSQALFSTVAGPRCSAPRRPAYLPPWLACSPKRITPRKDRRYETADVHVTEEGDVTFNLVARSGPAGGPGMGPWAHSRNTPAHLTAGRRSAENETPSYRPHLRLGDVELGTPNMDV